jgi:hypothetical protein
MRHEHPIVTICDTSRQTGLRARVVALVDSIYVVRMIGGKAHGWKTLVRTSDTRPAPAFPNKKERRA